MLLRVIFAAALAVATTLVGASAAGQQSTSPVIGIYAHPLSEHNETYKSGVQYVAASYVKWIEAAGGRAILIPYNSTESDIDKYYSQLNGFLFPGGGAGLPGPARYLYSKILKESEREDGETVPLWGTCLGFEWLVLSAGAVSWEEGRNWEKERKQR